MRKLVVLALVGLAAQLVDGALGMAFGVTATTLLLVNGINPAVASASVHLAELGTVRAGKFDLRRRNGRREWRSNVVLARGVGGREPQQLFADLILCGRGA